jgi:hypothetical protein
MEYSCKPKDAFALRKKGTQKFFPKLGLLCMRDEME